VGHGARRRILLRGQGGIQERRRAGGPDYIEEPPAEPLVVRVPLSRFDKGSLAADENSIAEPLTNVLGRDEERLYHQWMLSRRTWQDCLRIYESVWYNAPMEVTEADIL